MSECAIEGCGKPRYSKLRGWCQMHYTRWKRHGDPLVVKKVWGECSIEGCSGRRSMKGWCDKHYARWTRTGDPEGLLGPRTGPRERRDDVKYRQAHHRLGPVMGLCVDGCGEPAKTWSYNKKDPNQLVSDRGLPYSTSTEFYEARCYGCHTKKDRYNK